MHGFRSSEKIARHAQPYSVAAFTTSERDPADLFSSPARAHQKKMPFLAPFSPSTLPSRCDWEDFCHSGRSETSTALLACKADVRLASGHVFDSWLALDSGACRALPQQWMDAMFCLSVFGHKTP